MNGKLCLVTGGTSGVGRSIAAGCARKGAGVLIVGPDRARADEVARELRERTGNQDIEALQADLSSLDSVRALAAAVRRKHAELHVLSLNAAVLSMDRRMTPAGHECMFATNYLGHFLLTNLLLDLLRAGAPSRVLAVSGFPATIVGARLDMNDLMLTKGFNPLKATALAGLAKVLFTFELARRLQGSGVSANTFHPGLVRSGLARGLPWFLGLPVRIAMSFFPTGSAAGVHLATSPEVEGMTGCFYVGRRPVEFRPGYDVMAEAARLWDASEKLVGIS